MSYDRVTIVVDEAFGATATRQAALGPIWLVRSAENAQAVETLWADPDLPADHATVFDGSGQPETDFQAMLESVDEHHFGWTVLEVIGVAPSSDVEMILDPYGNGIIERTKDGFIFTRQPPPE